ncbi:MAG: hypothetical protein E7Z90_05925 [Cyanobacteria bacterium SIG29]|nr:hypothetical protein [Cyanobacteria bacterium SIG29]
MKKVLLLFTILFVSVITTACINNLAIQELNNKAAAYMDKGDTQTAICRLKSSLDLDTEIYQTHYNLAVAYNTIGNYEESIDESKKVIELKPDFAEAFYTLAVAKEEIAYGMINKEENEELSLDEISKFNNNAQEAIDAYNEYLIKKVNAQDSDKVNEHIEGLNSKIKELAQVYSDISASNQEKISEEINKQEQ